MTAYLLCCIAVANPCRTIWSLMMLKEYILSHSNMRKRFLKNIVPLHVTLRISQSLFSQEDCPACSTRPLPLTFHEDATLQDVYDYLCENEQLLVAIYSCIPVFCMVTIYSCMPVFCMVTIYSCMPAFCMVTIYSCMPALCMVTIYTLLELYLQHDEIT